MWQVCGGRMEEKNRQGISKPQALGLSLAVTPGEVV